MMMSGRNSRYPFTASQWQELEHQALIFKYMASGHPIPSDLILPIRRSILLDSSAPSSLFPHQPNIGWGCFQMGFGRKVEDPEPGRCRRTDGKKWRCSKEAHPDSKYCERHMHRGKNRSRKPVEMPQNATPTNITPTPTNHHNNMNNTSLYNSSSLYPHHSLSSMAASDAHNNPFYPYSSSYSRPSGIGLSPPKHHTQFSLDSGSSSSDRDYRYFHVLKEDADQYTCFSDGSGAERDGSWRFTPLGMSSLGEHPKQRSFLQQNCYSHLGTDFPRDVGDHREEEDQQQHCFVLGADFKLQRPARGDEEEEEESQKPLRRFLDDQWPLKHEKQWIDLEEDKSNWSSSFSKTQLSISTPVSHHDLSRTDG